VHAGTLEYLRRGGRIGAAASVIGGLLAMYSYEQLSTDPAHFLREVVAGIRSKAPGLGIAVRYGAIKKDGGNRMLATGVTTGVMAALFWLVPARELWMLYLFAAVSGFALGGMSAAESPLIAWLFGLRSHGLIFGVAELGFALGAAAGPFVTGYIFDVTGSYQLAFVIASVLSVIGLILTILLKSNKLYKGH
jgi:MFS family permease